jgi:oligosaccharide repeat unit polymerase
MLLLSGIILAIVLGFISARRWKRFKFRPISPACLYAIIWGCIWLIHYSDILHYFPLSDKAIIFSILPLLFIFVGEQMGLAIRHRPGPQRVLQKKRLYRLSRITGFYTVLAAVVVFGTVYHLLGAPWTVSAGTQIKILRVTEGVEAFASSSGPFYILIRLAGVSRGLFYVVLFLSIPMYFINHKMGNYCLAAGLISAALFDLAFQSRIHLLDVGFFVLMFFILKSPVIESKGIKKKKKILRYALVACIIIFCIFLAQIITSVRRGNMTENVGGIEVPYGIYQLLIYNTANLVTFDRTLDDNPLTYGGVSFGGTLSWISKLERLGIHIPYFAVYDIWKKWETQYPKYDDKGNGCNTYTWLRYLYSDFGVYGLIFVPLILGYLGAFFAKGVYSESARGFFNYIWLAFCYYIVFHSSISMAFRVDYIVFALLILICFKYFVSSHVIRVSVKRVARKSFDNCNSIVPQKII